MAQQKATGTPSLGARLALAASVLLTIHGSCQPRRSWRGETRPATGSSRRKLRNGGT
ncbi:hypothetical protein PF005_g23273 [Phytophthora fragariae]|uniref:RxLR effector protein n=1 Tax=Phytophthora fragariae TaxID=53985 RepID=A0A6A3WDG1_9STRA|nr:hypothetical protein PF003_g26610 [Phytophthora fragariae]KAE8926101.1 hypothetical protein PF009_g23702 [Phytophthora fragariae]KAE8992911.1 hypothetical protein PF011_g17357 [Phytophthora fragariae]KAE9071124.1 hypothetical protein PF010_g25997 [Phytophthora fragariae]KAE9079483.1 hypothetical protein PF007_g23427 [Phytophthora fragariae]